MSVTTPTPPFRFILNTTATRLIILYRSEDLAFREGGNVMCDRRSSQLTVAMATNLNINNAPALSYLANINNLSFNLLVPARVPNPSSAPLGSPLQGHRTVYSGRAPRYDGRRRPPRQYAEAFPPTVYSLENRDSAEITNNSISPIKHDRAPHKGISNRYAGLSC